MFIKFCGFTRIEDIKAAVELSVSAIGFIFYKKSKRYISPQDALNISSAIDGRSILKIGIFVDSPVSEIKDICHVAGLDCVQIYDHSVYPALRGFRKIIRAYRVGDISDIAMISMPMNDDLILIDSYGNGSFGGTGNSFNWNFLKEYPYLDRSIIAGGINEDNITQLVRDIRPFGIDMASCIEDAPGIKSHEKMKLIMEKIVSV